MNEKCLWLGLMVIFGMLLQIVSTDVAMWSSTLGFVCSCGGFLLCLGREGKSFYQGK